MYLALQYWLVVSVRLLYFSISGHAISLGFSIPVANPVLIRVKTGINEVFSKWREY